MTCEDFLCLSLIKFFAANIRILILFTFQYLTVIHAKGLNSELLCAFI